MEKSLDLNEYLCGSQTDPLVERKLKSAIRHLSIPVATLLAILVLGVLTFDVWAPLIARFLIVNKIPQKSDMIIIPSGTDEGGRIRYGVTLYKRGLAPKVFLSGASSLYNETGIDLMKIYTISLGVPERDIWVEHESGSTVGNAVSAKEIAKRNGCRSVLVATSPSHSRRVKMVFGKVFPKDIRITVSCDPSTFDVERWWKVPALAREVSYEYFVFFYYTLFGY